LKEKKCHSVVQKQVRIETTVDANAVKTYILDKTFNLFSKSVYASRKTGNKLKLFPVILKAAYRV